jgi:uncharacterized repeat protein (TIGR01451 family)
MGSFSGRLLGVLFAGVLLAGLSAAPAFAVEPWWHLSSSSRPANLSPGGEGTIVVEAVNVGDRATSGAVTFTDTLPAGVTAQSVQFFESPRFGKNIDLAAHCETQADRVQCTYPGGEFPVVNPYEVVEIRIAVQVAADVVSGAENRVEVSGGEAPAASLARPLAIHGATPFGVDDFDLTPEEEGGALDTRAGSHPFQLSSTIILNQTANLVGPPALVRDLQFKLPAGLVGNATALPQCSEQDFGFVFVFALNLCPANTVIGVVVLTLDEPGGIGLATVPVPLFNLVPLHGEPARFGFEAYSSPVTLDTSVRSGGDYGVTVTSDNITQLANVLSTEVTFWGVPGDPRHDQSRGWSCVAEEFWRLVGEVSPCQLQNQSNPAPFLTLPTSCEAPFAASLEGDSWPTKSSPGGLRFPATEYSLQDSLGRAVGLTGCNQLPFDPSIVAKPDGDAASTPTGLTATVHVPQEVNHGATGLASSSVKDIAVTFPEGVTVNPASADGLEACSEGQVGFEGFREFNPVTEPESKTALFTPAIGSPFCPDASKIGTVTLKIPLIAHPLEGALYLATQNSNPFGSLVAMYLVAEDPESGVLVKLPGEVSLNPVTGQVTATFKNSPQAPLETAEIHLFGGSRAPLSTPSHCGTYTTSALFTPWSGGPSVSSQSQFDITSGPNGSACPGSLPFAPTLAAGTTNINAGAFSPLVTTIGREDGNQNIKTVQLHMPAGLSGILAGVPLCGEAQANAGTCGQGSLIGHTVVSVGLGNEPFSVEGGEVFLTEGYAGAPFGLSIVNEAKAGPFDLGKVVVRAKIEVDPHTAQLTVTTGEIPHILQGIPLQIKHISVTIDRSGFTFNPTNCSKLGVTGSIGSVEGSSSPVAVPFQVTNCASLKFAPKFAVSTSGKTSKAQGASLTAKLSYPQASAGTYTNITRVKVDLPKQLPSRLTTLQKACTNAQFELNPANCPKESKIGFAKVTTPLLPVPLEGPAIFVSHGGEAFPSLTMVLQGAPPYNVMIDLVGTTFISKAGITSTTFKTVPDVPFNTFQLTLPQGKFSALAANGNLCTSKLAMPTEFLAQNGAKINQSTTLSVTGCAKTKALTRPQKLAKALKTCKKKAKGKRASCEKQARKQYGPMKKTKKKK